MTVNLKLLNQFLAKEFNLHGFQILSNYFVDETDPRRIEIKNTVPIFYQFKIFLIKE